MWDCWSVSSFPSPSSASHARLVWSGDVVGSVNQRQEASAAVAEAVAAVGEYVQHQPVVGMDETSFIQGNSDGNNPQHTKGWLWVLVTPLISYFQVC